LRSLHLLFGRGQIRLTGLHASLRGFHLSQCGVVLRVGGTCGMVSMVSRLCAYRPFGT
jgi:hypothetical protein